jgi:hypothetical protein
MTFVTQLKNINEFMISFLTEQDSTEDLLEIWNSLENQTKFLQVLHDAMNTASKTTKTTKDPKDPNAPKRGKSAYILFCSNTRDKTIQENPGLDAKNIISKLGEKWRELKKAVADGDVDKIKTMNEYIELASCEKDQYNKKMEIYVPLTEEELGDIKGKKTTKNGRKKKNPDSPKRNKSAYLFFCSEQRIRLKNESPSMVAKEVTSKLGELWTNLKKMVEENCTVSINKMNEFVEKALQDKERYTQEMDDYSGTDQREKKMPIPRKSKKKFNKEEVEKKVEVEEEVEVEVEVEEEVKEEVEEEVKVVKTKKVATKKVATKSGYVLFTQQNRERVKLEFGITAKAAEVTKKLSDLWKELSQEQKNEFNSS